MPSPADKDIAVPSLESTAQLLTGARQGDARARERLFARFLPVLRSWAHRRLPARARDLTETDDLVQVTLLRALNRLHDLEPREEGSFLAYLRHILLNAVREEIRRSARRGPHDGLCAELSDGSASVVERAMGRESMELYERALGTLTEDQQQAVVLRLEFDYSYLQVAEALGRPSADAARMLVVRALVQLARAMDA